MTSGAEAAYAELQRRYWKRTKAPKAARMIRTGEVDDNNIDINWVLRHHTEEAIEDEETWYRDYVDDLLHFFSILEIAIMTGCITKEILSIKDRRLAIELLTHPAVQRYYERNYPLLLPTLFRRRLEGDGVRSIESENRFRDFLNVSRAIEGDESVDTFLWFLDGGQYRDGNRWVGIDDTLEALASAEQMARLLKKGHGARARSVEGFRRFAVFCEQFDRLLRASNDTPIVRDAFWHAHGYWFHRMRKRVGATMDQGVNNLLKAARSGEANTLIDSLTPNERQSLAKEVERHAAELKRAIGRLTHRVTVPPDAVYGSALTAFTR